MIEYTLISSVLNRICEMTTKPVYVKEMAFGYSPFSICWKLEHGEQNGKEQLKKLMNGQLNNCCMQRQTKKVL